MSTNVIHLMESRHAAEDAVLAELGVGDLTAPARPARLAVGFGEVPVVRSRFRRWWGRVCPTMPGELSTLDRMDGVS